MRNLLDIILTILKASSWGVLLFLIICFIILEVWMAYLNVSSIKPLSVANEASNTMLKINSYLSRLEAISQAEDSQTRQRGKKMRPHTDNDTFTMRDVLIAREKAEEKEQKYTNKAREMIRPSLENDCPNCGLDVYHFVTIPHLKNTLERLSIRKNIIIFNMIKYLSLLISSIAILFGIYLVLVLFSYKKITVRDVVIVILLSVPIMLALIALPMITADPDFNKYLDFTISSKSVENIIPLLGFAIVYFFLVYPPIFLICANKKISIKKALFLRTCCGAP